MRSSDDLFLLIKSLTRSEKRYFRLSASLYRGEKNYLRLFDAIDAMEVYDEQRIREQFHGERFLGQLNVARHYLYSQIMRSLRACHEKEDVRQTIRNLIRDMEILYEKGLHRQAARLCESALRIADEHEEFVMKLEILEWHDRLNPELTSTQEGIETIYSSVYDTIDDLRNYIDHAAAARKVALPVVQQSPRTTDDLSELQKIMRHLPEGDEVARSARAEILYAWTHATYHFARRDYAPALSYTRRQIEVLHERPGLIATHPTEYLSAVNNLLLLLKRGNDIEGFLAESERLRSRADALIAAGHLARPRLRAALFAVLTINRMTMHLAHGRPECSAPLCTEVEQGLAEHERYLNHPTLLKFHQNLALLHFECGAFECALDYNMRIINGRMPIRFRDCYHHARLMNLVIHYELGHHDLLEHLVVSVSRYFRRHDILRDFERTLLCFFRGLSRLHGQREELLAHLHSTRSRLAHFLADPLQSESFRSFQYLDWIDGKIAALQSDHVAVPLFARQTSHREVL